MPVRRRASASPATSFRSTGLLAPPDAPHAGRWSSSFCSTSSTNVFQPLQSGHLPSHFAVWNPHA